MAVAEWVGKQVGICARFGNTTEAPVPAAAAVVPLTQREELFMQSMLRTDVELGTESAAVLHALKQSHPISAEGKQWRVSKAKPKL
jgi:hypothetical protein